MDNNASIRQYRDALEEAESGGKKVTPTRDDIRNGWTEEALTAYFHEQEAAAQVRIDPLGASRRTPPRRANSGYSPLNWRKR